MQKKILLNLFLCFTLFYPSTSRTEFELPALPYPDNALEPYIDAETMRIHHDKHHQAYVTKLNTALVDYPNLQQRSLRYLVKNRHKIPKEIRAAVRHNAGGDLNHTLFWQWMTPNKPSLNDPLRSALIRDFGSVKAFKKEFNAAAKKVFGSGWAWLVMDKKGNLLVTSTKNQDNPITDGVEPILGLDVWEHAYYLKYQNRRPTYIDAWWHVVNWDRANTMYKETVASMPKPLRATFVIPGITGDLAKRKIIPALYTLVKKGFDGLIIGTGRRENVSVKEILADSRFFISDYKQKIGKKLSKMMVYKKLNVKDAEDFSQLASFINEQEVSRNLPRVRVAYLSIPPQAFCSMTERLVSAGVIQSKNPQHRIAYEKPFGWDVKSARGIQKCINTYLSRAQVYRVDHYLAKTIVATLPFILSANSILHDSWNNKTIQAVHIFVDEKLGVEGRGSFYDPIGALKDIVQNHLLQLLTRVAVIDTKHANQTDPQNTIAHRAAQIVQSLRIADGVLGQYEGYTKEEGVDPSSKTETFAGLKLFIDDAQWQGVPFYIQTGKKLGKKLTEIRVIFKNQYCQPESSLKIEIAPKERIKLNLFAKKDNDVTTVNLHTGTSPIEALDGYALLLRELVEGSRTADVSFKEIEAQWKFIERVKKRHFPMVSYKPGSAGPAKARRMWASTKMLPVCVAPKADAVL